MTTFIIIWVLCAIPAAIIAYYKKLDPAAWFFVGAILGVFGIVIVLCQSSRASAWWGAEGMPDRRRGWERGRDGGSGGGGHGGCGGGGCGGGGCGGG